MRQHDRLLFILHAGGGFHDEIHMDIVAWELERSMDESWTGQTIILTWKNDVMVIQTTEMMHSSTCAKKVCYRKTGTPSQARGSCVQSHVVPLKSCSSIAEGIGKAENAKEFAGKGRDKIWPVIASLHRKWTTVLMLLLKLAGGHCIPTTWHLQIGSSCFLYILFRGFSWSFMR